MPSNYLIPCCPLSFLPSIFPSIRIFSKELALHISWPKYWSFGFSISPFYEYSRLISFRMDWLDLLAVQGTLKSLLQHHSSKASILQRLAFFMVQLSHPYVTTGKTIALTIWTFVCKINSLLFLFVHIGIDKGRAWYFLYSLPLFFGLLKSAFILTLPGKMNKNNVSALA